MRALILDGYHKGETLTLGRRGSEPLPALRLIKPAAVTVCDCDPGISATSIDSAQRIIEYKLAAVSRSDDFALYSEKGDLFDPMTKGRTWIVKADSMAEPEPIILGCHDPKAFL